MPVKFLTSAPAGLGVEALRIAALALLDRGVDEHLDEPQSGRVVHGTGAVAARPVRADHRHESDDAGIGEQPGDLADPADVLVAVLGGEPEIAVDAEPQVVTVEEVRRLPGRDQQPFDLGRHRGLARTREARERHGCARDAEPLPAIRTR